MTIEEIYNNEILPLGEIYTYIIYYTDDRYLIQSEIIQNLGKTDCLNFLQNIIDRGRFSCWALDSRCLGKLPYPINTIPMEKRIV